MASIASLVPKARPTLISALLLAVAAFALRDGHGPHACGRSHVPFASLHSTLLRAPQTLDWSAPPPEVDPWDTRWRARNHLPLISPPEHPDAQPWPRGMVMGTPAIDEAIVLLDGSPLDNVLSVFFTVLGLLRS